MIWICVEKDSAAVEKCGKRCTDFPEACCDISTKVCGGLIVCIPKPKMSLFRKH